MEEGRVKMMKRKKPCAMLHPSLKRKRGRYINQPA
jgi:hypothetical protein